MANYQLLKADIDEKVYQNGRQEITGQILNSVLNQMVNTLGAGYQFAGVATTATNPGTPDAKVFYIANGKGTYTNFDGIEVTEDEVVILYWDSSWHKVSTGIASQEKLTELGTQVIYDVTANNNGATFASLSALLSDENLSTLIPSEVRCGGMSLRFVQSSDNKYVQYRLMSNAFSTTVSNWQGVDDEPTAGSDNLVKSGAVEKYLAKDKNVVYNPEGTSGGITVNGEIVASDSYIIVRPILLKSGETISLNKGENVYLGYRVAVVFKTDSNGNWQETLIAGSSVTTKVSFTNTTNADIYIGTCTYTDQRSYAIQTLVEAASKQSIADFLAIHGNPLNQEDALSVLGRINAASVFNYGYATISNNADVAAKTITKQGFQLTTNMMFIVRCYTKNTADNVTLNINNTGAKNLYYNGQIVSSKNTWETDTYALLWYNDSSYNMYGLDFNIIRRMFADYGVTNSIDNVNLMVRELYLTGLNPNNNYYISTIRKDTAQSRWGLYINPENAYGVDYAVAQFWASEKPNGFIKLDATNGSGISGYAIVDWSQVPDVGYTQLNNNAKIFTVKASDINFSPSILANLTSSTLDNIEEEIDNVRELAEKNTGSNWQNVYNLANNIKENKPYFLNSDYSDESSYDGSSYLDAKIRNIPNGKHFLFVTDTHIGYDNGMQLKETEIMAYVKAKLNAGTVVFGGDAVGQQDTPYKAAKELAVYSEDKFNAFGPDFIWCQGNHDANANINLANKIISSEIYKRTTGIMSRYGKAVFDTEGISIIKTLELSDSDKTEAIAWMNLHYYYDDNISKIRFIVLETGDGSNGAGIVGSAWSGWENLIGYNAFIGKALQTAPDGYDVVIVMHQLLPETSFTDNAEITQIPQKGIGNVFGMAAAFKNKATITITGDSTSQSSRPVLYALMRGTIGDGVTFDFSNRTAGRIFIISGHFHMDDAWIFQNSGSSPWYYAGKEYGQWDTLLNNAILAIQTDRATINDKGSWAGGNKAPHATTAPNNTDEQRIGTKNEVLFDVVTITPDNKVVCTRIGAGNDRTYDLPTQS